MLSFTCLTNGGDSGRDVLGVQSRILRVGGFVLQIVNSQWEREGERAGEGTSDGGGEWPTSCLLTNWRVKGRGGGMFPPPFHSSPGGYRIPERGEVSFGRPEGRVT